MKNVVSIILLIIGISTFSVASASSVNFGSNTKLKNTSKTTKNFVYTIKGIKYKTLTYKQSKNFSEKGIASIYGGKSAGGITASGEVFDGRKYTAAHKTLPIPSYVLVTNPKNKKQIVVLINDRGPFIKGRIIDLSIAAAKGLGFNHEEGIVNVSIDIIHVDNKGKMSGPGYEKIKHKL